VSVFRSNANFYLTLVDDSGGKVFCALSTLSKEFKEKKLSHSNTVEAARLLAGMFVEKVKKNGVTSVVFDRSGYRYHGRVKVVAESLREHGLLA
jgi:large subunit ribosomal protein L18